MDRISALRNVEEALRAFERGETDLAATEHRVVTVLRTYATEFGDETDVAAYRATGEDPADGVVVVADSRPMARDRITALVDGDPTFDVERLG